jgi:hypothetical protein
MPSAIETNFTYKQEYLDQFWKFIYDRHLIWYKRFVLGLEAPWTTDPILLEYKFTNVYRELDRGTVFLLDNILGHGSPIEQVWNIIIYRMFNRISTFEAIGFQHLTPWKRKEMYDILRHRQDVEKQPLYTDAHMVCAYEHFPGDDKLDRMMYIFGETFKKMKTLYGTITRAKSLQHVWSDLTHTPGIGPFLAYEMAVDISYASWNNLGEDEWVNAGPGCQRGLMKMFPGLKPQECPWMIKVLRQAQVKEFERLNLPFKDIAYLGRELTLRNIEHCCCECFKYFKALEGSGRPRNKFKPSAVKGAADFNRLKGQV